MGKLQFRTFERKPFRVEAVKITEENIDEIGELIGEVRIHRRTKHKFIITNPKIVSEVGMVYIGWYLTRFKGRYRCYKPIAFEKEFIRVRKNGYRGRKDDRPPEAIKVLYQIDNNFEEATRRDISTS